MLVPCAFDRIQWTGWYILRSATKKTKAGEIFALPLVIFWLDKLDSSHCRTVLVESDGKIDTIWR